MKLSQALAIAGILAAALWTMNAHADEKEELSSDTAMSSTEKKVTISIATGVHSFPQMGMFGPMPFPASAALSVDMQRFRVRTDIGYHLSGLIHWTIGAGILLSPVGSAAQKEGGFQFKIPICVHLGYIGGEVEAHDGYYDEPKWLVAGPTVGTEFVWWKADKFGFLVSLNAGYLFRADVGSSFDESYSYIADHIGTLNLSLMLGIAI